MADLEKLLSERDAAEKSGIVGEGRGDDEFAEVALKRGVGEIAVEIVFETLSHHWEKVLLMRDAAAEDDAGGRGDGEDVEAGLREVVRLEFPGLVIGGELVSGSSPASSDGTSGGKPLKTIAVKGALTFKRILRVPLHAHVSHLGVAHAVDELSVDHDRAANPGADSEVGSIF